MFLPGGTGANEDDETTCQTKTIRSEEALFEWLLGYLAESESPRRYSKGVVEAVQLIIDAVPKGIDAAFICAEFGDDFSIVPGLMDKIASGRGMAVCRPSLVRWSGRVLDEFNGRFVTFEQSNRFLIEVLRLQKHFLQVERADGIWLVDGTPLRRLGYRVELKQKYEYIGCGFYEPIGDDVLELL
jgi:hypothetical protein